MDHPLWVWPRQRRGDRSEVSDKTVWSSVRPPDAKFALTAKMRALLFRLPLAGGINRWNGRRASTPGSASSHRTARRKPHTYLRTTCRRRQESPRGHHRGAGDCPCHRAISLARRLRDVGALPGWCAVWQVVAPRKPAHDRDLHCRRRELCADAFSRLAHGGMAACGLLVASSLVFALPQLGPVLPVNGGQINTTEAHLAFRLLDARR